MTFLRELGVGPCPFDPARECGDGSPFAMNDHGDIVGQARSADGSTHAVLWPSKGAPIDLGGFIATLVNEHEQVVVDNSSLWDDGNRQSFDGGAIALNDHGVVTGGRFTPEFKSHAFVWDNGTFTDLGTGPGDNSRGLAINIRGDVIGYYFGSDFVTRAIVWRKVQK
jgi:probable HAF family extracellular repeat protein